MAPRLPSSLAAGPSSSTSFARASTRPCLLSLAAATTSPCYTPATTGSQTRHATYIHRPRRPYTFTQLIQLSDGSTFTTRTTSPLAMHRCDKDSRNTLLWQPSEKSLQNVEQDEAGKLAAFRQRFGHGFDLDASVETESKKGAARARREAEGSASAKKDDEKKAFDLGDLISGYAEGIEEVKGGIVQTKREKKDKK